MAIHCEEIRFEIFRCASDRNAGRGALIRPVSPNPNLEEIYLSPNPGTEIYTGPGY